MQAPLAEVVATLGKANEADGAHDVGRHSIEVGLDDGVSQAANCRTSAVMLIAR